MVLIISYEEDHSTNEVIKYLHVFGVKYIRLGIDQFINSFCITIGKKIDTWFSIAGKKIYLDEIRCFWYRKHFIEITSQLKLNFTSDEIHLDSPQLTKYILDELDSVREFLIHQLLKKAHVGNPVETNGNKLIAFSIAMEVGLETPTTTVSSNRNHLLNTFSRSSNLIVKSVEDGYFNSYNKTFVSAPYHMVSIKHFENKEDELFPSCLQEYLDKKIEIRIFYLKGKFWSMAIFSQSDSQTRLDFRNYNKEKPNRMVPYSLPTTVERKLKKFMNKMQLDTGSIDMVLTTDNKYIFLEVNPVGQYGMIAQSCNYNLDKFIAKLLTHDEK